MNKSYDKKHPIILSVIYVILLSFFAAISVVIATLLKMSQIQTMLTQIVGFLLSIIIALTIIAKSKYSFNDYFVCFQKSIDKYSIFGIVSLVLVEGITIFAGIGTHITPTYIIVLLVLMIVVGINEEIYFRGLVLKTLSNKGTSYAIIVSSILFSFAHLGSLFVGNGVGHTFALLAYSALMAFVFAEIVMLTRSIMIPIIWHFTHNFVSSITAEASTDMTILIVCIQSAILLIYAIYLWIGLKRNKQMLSDKEA